MDNTRILQYFENEKHFEEAVGTNLFSFSSFFFIYLFCETYNGKLGLHPKSNILKNWKINKFFIYQKCVFSLVSMYECEVQKNSLKWKNVNFIKA